jgi:hypothetical protein
MGLAFMATGSSWLIAGHAVFVYFLFLVQNGLNFFFNDLS